MRFIICIISLFFIFTACKTDSPTNQAAGTDLSATFLVRYLEDNQELKGQALFVHADTSNHNPIAAFPGGLGFMGSGTRAVPLPGNTIRYEGVSQDFYPSSFRFEFRPNEKADMVTVNLEMEGLEGYKISESVSLSEGGKVKLNHKLGEQEQLILLFTDEANVTRTLIVQGPTTVTDVTLETPLLANLKVGSYEVNGLKKKTWQGEEGDIPMNMAVEYYALMQKVEVVE